MNGDLLNAVISWPTLLIVLVVYGFAPRLVLRLIVLAFQRDDPRRPELLAELDAVPRWERPLWVAEQLEVALIEGLGQRVLLAATGRIIRRWHLGDGVIRNREHPDTFDIPEDDEKALIQSGMFVKLMFEMKDGWCERMWVQVTRIDRRRMVGELRNQPIGIPRLTSGAEVRFTRDHVIDIDVPEEFLETLEE